MCVCVCVCVCVPTAVVRASMTLRILNKNFTADMADTGSDQFYTVASPYSTEVSQSVCLSPYQSVCLPACLPVCLTSVCQSSGLSVGLSVCPPACLSVCLGVCLSVSPCCPLFVFSMSCLCIFLYCFVCALGYLICLSNCVYPFN